jgi:GNAT superfamily N-acetyltransferase
MDYGSRQIIEGAVGNTAVLTPDEITDLLLDPVAHALDTTHAHFAIGSRLARRYPANVAPFAVVADYNSKSFSALADLLAPRERFYLVGDRPVVSKPLTVGPPLRTFQMIGPEHVRTAAPAAGDSGNAQLLLLGSHDAAAMFELISLAFPGFYQPQTYRMGTYYGIYQDAKLVAMAGERLCMTGLREISGVCTRPGYTGRGYANLLMTRVMQDHVAMGVKSFLHVGSSNSRAVALYQWMGFRAVRAIDLWPISLAG